MGSPFQRHQSYPSVLNQGTAWYRADSLVTLNGSTVSAWGDRTGNGNTATQGTEASQFTFVASAINGKPGLQSDGGDGLALTASLFGTTAFSLFYMAHIIPDSTFQIWFRQKSSGGAPYDVRGSSGDNRIELLIRGNVNTSTSTHSSVLTEGDYIVGIRFDGSVSAANRVRISINGDSETLSVDNSSVSAVDGDFRIFRLSANKPPSGSQILEGVTYDSAVSDADFTTIEQYMATRYGITLA